MRATHPGAALCRSGRPDPANPKWIFLDFVYKYPPLGFICRIELVSEASFDREFLHRVFFAFWHPGGFLDGVSYFSSPTPRASTLLRHRSFPSTLRPRALPCRVLRFFHQFLS